MSRFTFFFLILISIVSPSTAQIVERISMDNIGKSVLLLEDPKHKLQIQDIEKLGDHAYRKGSENILNLGNTKSAWWFKISYQNQAQQSTQLIIDAPNIEYIEVYAYDDNNNLKQYKTGSLQPKSKDVIIRNNYIVALPKSNNNSIKTVYIKVYSNNILLVPIKISNIEQVLEKEALLNGFTYVCFGLLIGLLLYNLFLYFSIKDITYLYYVFYVLTLTCYFLFYLMGFSYVLGEKARFFFNKYPHIWIGTSLFFVVVFCRSFLNIEKKRNRLQYLLYLVQFFGLLIFLTSLFGYKSISASLTQVFSFLAAIIVGYAGIVAYIKGHKAAVYYIITWITVGTSIIFLILSLSGFFEVSKFTMLLIPISSIIEVFILSFALGNRYNINILTEKQLREENLILIKTQNQILEERVEERTAQLNESIIELEKSNSIKNKLFSIIAHDLKSPLNSLIGILSLNDMKALTPPELSTLLSENKKSIDSITNTINNLLQWAKSQMDGSKTIAQTFDINIIIEELVTIYLPLIKQKSIQIELKLNEDGKVVADQNQINLVIRNLIDNAIKFTPINGQITIAVENMLDKVKIKVSNKIHPNHKIKIEDLTGDKIATSTLGTDNEKGVGLGLLLCHEYLQHNHSELHKEINNQQISFWFLLNAENQSIS